MTSYYFRYRRSPWGFWRKLQVIGHQYVPDQNKMVVYLPDGSLREIARWTSCEVLLGVDWVAFTKKSLEKEAGQPIVTNV